MNPKVSIVLPTFRRPALLDVAITSVVNQSFSDWELIVVDDCSGDETGSKIQHWVDRDSRVRLITNPSNLHLPKSLNVGFSHARGEFLSWTSDDNRYLPGALETMVEALEASPESVLAYTSMCIINEQGEPVRQWIAELPENQPLQPWVGACFLYRREAAERIGPYEPDFYLAEDLDFWIRLRLQGNMISIPEVHYEYLVHRGSLSQTLKERARQVSAQVVAKHLDKIHWLPSDAMSEAALGVADAAIRRGDYRTARRFVRIALKHHPARVVKTFKRGAFLAFSRP